MGSSGGNKFIDAVDECLTNGVKNGIFQVSVDDDVLDGRTVSIQGKDVINFGSCSYLGLEIDERLKQGAIDATTRYGTQYSASRAFSACNLYEELEGLFDKIFDNNHSILAATTTLTHVAAIPILVQDNDLIILDHQVHGSVQLAVQLVKARGTKVEMIRHNRLDVLEDLIKVNPNKYNKIWYMADGLYSMYGDFAPLAELTVLLNKYHNFHIYIDDAHGMSWTGKHGSGYVFSQMPLHAKMVLSTSLAKGFGTGGGVLVVPDKEMKRKILTCGSSYTFSGPVQPPMLGASIASAKIHLSDEIEILQKKLRERIELTKRTIKELSLPSVFPSNSPIFYLGLGMPRVGYNMVKRLLNEGFYANIGIFPAVPVKCTGLRLPISNNHTNDDIENVLKAFAYHLPKVMEEENITLDNLSKSFNMPFEETKKKYSVSMATKTDHNFEVQHETTIHRVDKQLWDDLLGDSGTFDWEGCRFLEETFKNNKEPENNWNFHYIIIKDQSQQIILATFFTEVLCKDDMIAPATVSTKIEEVRKKEKYYLTSKVIMLGSLITIGEHLYLNRESKIWREALMELLKVMNAIKVKSNANTIQLRDFDSNDSILNDLLIKEGFISIKMPNAHTLLSPDWIDEEAYLKKLSTKSRWHFRRNILDKRSLSSATVLSTVTEKTLGQPDKWYALYENVKNKSLNINTYPLPRKYFSNMINHPNWEIIELRLTSDEEVLVAACFCYKSTCRSYSFVAVGLDYNYVLSHGSYRQCLYQAVSRANNLKVKQLYLGMDASIEKRKFGVEIQQKNVFIQANDNFNMELMGLVHS